MINLSFRLSNPFVKRWDNIWNYAKSISKHKGIEIEVFRDSTIIDLTFTWTARTSHAGVHLDVGLFGVLICFSVYDSRHWDHEKDEWINYD